MTSLAFYPATLGKLWFAMPGLLAFCPMLLGAFFGLPSPSLWITTCALVMLWGLWLKYRARLGNPLQIAAYWFFAKLAYLSFAVGSLGWILSHVMRRPDLLGWAGSVALLSLLMPWLAGLVQAGRRMQREGVGADAAWLQAMVDLQRGAMRARIARDAQQESALKTYFWPLIGLGLNLPLMLELAGTERNYVLFLVVPMFFVLGWIGAMPAGCQFAYLIGVHRFEQQSGRQVLAAHEDELNQVRRGFWLSRWLCRPVPEAVAPQPRTRGARRAKG